MAKAEKEMNDGVDTRQGDAAVEDIQASEKTGNSDPLEQVIDELNTMRERQTGSSRTGVTGLLKNVTVNLDVILGKAQVSVAQANAFEPGSTIQLDSQVGDDVTLAVGGVVIGRGKVIIAPDDPDYFAIKITSITNDKER